MTQEEKSLLLQDLCARLPYGVRLKIGEHSDYTLYGIVPNREHQVIVRLIENEREYDIDVYVKHIKPYLRPMSSMTEEEKEEIAFIRDRDFQSVRKWFRDESIKETENICPITCGEIDFCNKKHLDYRGLIPMGLALKAPKGMYNINEK